MSRESQLKTDREFQLHFEIEKIEKKQWQVTNQHTYNTRRDFVPLLHYNQHYIHTPIFTSKSLNCLDLPIYTNVYFVA